MTHTPMFHQSKGIVVGEAVSFANLKGHAAYLRRAFLRTALGHAPAAFVLSFTEPSAEVDIECVFCRGAGCRVCKQTGWLEILAAA